jgi:DNA-binding LacI/PurR family transcriptional regulator
MAVTQKDIARKLGISQQAVASALSAKSNGKGQSRISDETRLKVLNEAQLLGYRPNLAARALTKQRTHLIAVWTRNFSSSYYAEILQHIEARLRTSGYEMIVRVIPEDPSSSLSQQWQMAQWPVDGIIAIEAAQTAHQWKKLHGQAAPPIVCVGGYDKTAPELDYVWVDLYQSTYDAVQHLIEQGCQRIATLIHSLGFVPGSPRYDAYAAAMRDAGRQPEYIVVPETTRIAGRLALESHLSLHGCPDGIFCYNDDLGIGTFRFLRNIGKQIPDDVALVGCDGIEEAQYLEQPLSTIIAPVDEMCAKAWDLLQRRMNDGEIEPQHEVLPARLKIQASSQRKKV